MAVIEQGDVLSYGTWFALTAGMKTNKIKKTERAKTSPLECHIGSFQNQSIDPALAANGFAHSMLAFCFPSLGISFKCRANGGPLELEFGAFFAALKFMKTRLKDQKITKVRIHSSLPAFVFSFMPGSQHLAKGSARHKLLKEYSKDIQLEVAFVEQYRNQIRLSPSDCPRLPKGQEASLKPDFNDMKKVACRPFQKGIQL